MNAILVRIGVDQAYGGWNAPADPSNGEFVFVPIPEPSKGGFHPGCDRRYREVRPVLERFLESKGTSLPAFHRKTWEIDDEAMHLDPDFEHLTYGDIGSRRGSHIKELTSGDLLVFYAGMKPLLPLKDSLIYGLIGLLVVDDVVSASAIAPDRWHENAHTRKVERGEHDIVVRAKKFGSGRFTRFIDIGEYRDRAYRVRRDVLDEWGGLSVKNGYLQRSARPPRFNAPERFLSWLEGHNPELIHTSF